jgi:DNA mismatch endonuclease (patch repair protein)
MADTFSTNERSRVMRAVKSSGNKSTELRVIELFKRHGLKGWRRNYPIFGKPDFVFPKTRVALFCDGCFWHGHDCRNTKPKQNAEFWGKKIARNKRRDRETTRELTERGWTVVRLWECELKRDFLPPKAVSQIKGELP